MCLFVSLIPASILAVIGYFLLYISTKVQGRAHTLGRGLALWVFFLGLFFPLVGAYVTMSDQCPVEQMIEEIERKTD